ncbi:hypothetical protein FRC09_004769 [Ceratobasidium sp. 395]|nr:hypothetical protein FRC09_004769 [Ceratobasidium sp. 395]
MSSESELTDPSSDYDVESTQESTSKKRKAKSSSTYVIKDALKQPSTASYATDWLAKQMKTGDIKVDPEYQRNVVWSDAKQSKLIDSILRNFYVPPILFCISEDSTGNQTRICIDGKQRLTSIRRFLDGLIPHKDGYVQKSLGSLRGDDPFFRRKMSFYFKQADGTKAVRLLPEPLRKQFRNKTLVCIEYRELSPVHEREMFQRVQLGMALTTGEQLQSFDGPMAQFVHRIHAELFEKAHIETEMNLAIERGRGFQNLVQTIACIARLPEYVHATYPQQTKLLQCQGMSPEAIRVIQSKSERALRLLKNIASDAQLCASAFSLPARATRNSPVEFCFSVLLIAMRMDEPGVGQAQLAQAIGMMRAAMRAIHVDMRSNSNVAMSFWNYLNGKHQEPSQVGSSTQVVATPAVKKPRVKPPLTPETPIRAHHAQGSQSSTTTKPHLQSPPRSETSAQFHGIFGSNTSEQSSDMFHSSLSKVKSSEPM